MNIFYPPYSDLIEIMRPLTKTFITIKKTIQFVC